MADMDSDEDGVVAVMTMRTVIKQCGLGDDEVMVARIRKMERDKLLDLVVDPTGTAALCMKLLRIVAYTYQVCGAHDADERILDVLGDPEGATEEQIEAMLPYSVQP